MASAAPALERTLPADRPATARSPFRAILTADRLVLLAVAGAALVLAAIHYRQFLDVRRSLWDHGLHDRNAHYLFALRLATDARQGRLGQLLVDLDSARVWPPLHGAVAAVILLAGGLDYRLAVLPSLAAWFGTVVFAFLVARRAVPRGGNVAGLVAALLTAVSPAYRAYATDVMLESTGACLSLAVLYGYLAAVQGRSVWAGRWLGIALTALFLHKYNYWLLVLLALVACTALAHRRFLLDAARRAIAGFGWRAAARSEVGRPLNCVLGVVLLLIAGVYAHGDRPFVWRGHAVSLYPPHNITHVAYVLVFVRLAAWWFAAGRAAVARLPLRVRQVVYWHACPVAVWFLLPKHLGYFLWFLSPSNAEPGKTSNLLAGLTDYARWAADDYHAAQWSAALVAALIVAAVASCRWLRPGGAAVLWLVLFGTVLAAPHPNRKGRFLHSWLAAAWVAAGMGTAALTHGRLTARRPGVRPWLAGAALGALACTHGPALTPPGHAPEGGPHPSHPSTLDLTDSYLNDLTATRRVAVLTTLGIKPLVQWTYLERHGSLDGLENAWYGFGAAGGENRDGFLRWLRTTDCDTVVVCEPLPGMSDPPGFEERQLHREMIDLLPRQTVFVPSARRELLHLNAAVTLWRRAPGRVTGTPLAIP